MEIHSVLPEERAKDINGETLPWAYRYADSSRNARVALEESGPFGRNRSLRSSGTRTSRARTGTTPVRQKENPTVAEFGRLFAKEQAKEEEERSKRTLPTSSSTTDAPRIKEPESVPTECILYGYAGRSSEWKVISKYERIVAPSIICEDYPREDPDLLLTSSTAFSRSRSAVVVHNNLSKEAIKKARIYKGGDHWIKITFDSFPAAERACFYSPIEIDGHLVFCEMYQGRPPFSDSPILKGASNGSELQRNHTNARMRNLTTSQPSAFTGGNASAIAGFERAMHTLPRSHTMPDVQYGKPATQDDSSVSSVTASSATATTDHLWTPASNLRSQSVPQLPTAPTTPANRSEYMTAIPSVRRAVLRPMSEALPPQPSVAERFLRSVPVVNWFVAAKPGPAGPDGDLIGEGPVLKEDGSWDLQANGWYWSFWHGVDTLTGTDFCGLREE